MKEHPSLMKRPIKFRAWDSALKMMVNDVHANGPYFSFSVYLKDKDMIVEQFTGLHDKNGREIYEGDILRWNGMICPITVETFHGMRFMWGLDCLCQAYAITGEVIGNVHENPELLGIES